jgi:hypothetical protein
MLAPSLKPVDVEQPLPPKAFAPCHQIPSDRISTPPPLHPSPQYVVSSQQGCCTPPLPLARALPFVLHLPIPSAQASPTLTPPFLPVASKSQEPCSCIPPPCRVPPTQGPPLCLNPVWSCVSFALSRRNRALLLLLPPSLTSHRCRLQQRRLRPPRKRKKVARSRLPPSHPPHRSRLRSAALVPPPSLPLLLGSRKLNPPLPQKSVGKKAAAPTPVAAGVRFPQLLAD